MKKLAFGVGRSLSTGVADPSPDLRPVGFADTSPQGVKVVSVLEDRAEKGRVRSSLTPRPTPFPYLHPQLRCS